MNKGNILSVSSGIVVHGCNAQGVMGSGLAKQIKNSYPDAYRDYKNEYKKYATHDKGKSWLGSVVYSAPNNERGFYIAHAITQQFYGRDPSKIYVDYNAVQKCFENIASFAKDNNQDVHYPMIGAGLGGGDWNLIQEIIKESLGNVKSNLWVFSPHEKKPSYQLK